MKEIAHLLTFWDSLFSSRQADHLCEFNIKATIFWKRMWIGIHVGWVAYHA
jgi:hypothetical protein